MAASAASTVARSVGDLATKEASFLCGVHDEVEFLREELTSLKTFLSVAAEAQRSCGGDALAADSVRRIRDVAYEAENIVEAADYRAARNIRRKGILGAMSRFARKPNDLVALHRLGKDILRVRRRIQDIKSSREVLDAIDASGCVTGRAQEPSARRARLLRPTVTGDEFVVGFDADVQEIVARLKDSGVLHLTIISIVAMGGAGKTTLARKVYNSAAAKEHFDAFAFVSISQQFEPPQVLKEIISQVLGLKRGIGEFDRIGQADELGKMGEQELADTLHNFLQGKRYLVVLDDVWRTDTWEVIQHAFPDQKNGSRVMLTTRNSQVANQADKLTQVHEVRLLNEHESWQLFSLKAFPSYESIDANNRQELEFFGRNLAKKCHGLPLALVVLGSHLSKNLHLDAWSKMEQCLDWEVTSKWMNMQQIIALSYDDLPSHFLKDCFLYIASFPEDFEIEAEELEKSWVAEDFVPHRPNQTPEDIAYDFLEELVQRSMVHIVQWSDVLGRIWTVQMHDILREWVIQKARKEGFLKLCKSHDDVSDRMLAYRSSFLDFFDNRIFTFAPKMRSMFGFHLASITLGTPRFLRVLYMFDTNLEKVSKVLGRLVHLRYIGLIKCKNVELPSSIGQLLTLESIDLKGTHIPRLPKSLWDIPTLRHVEIPEIEASFSPTTIRAEEQSELQTLYIYSSRMSLKKLRTDSAGWIRLKEHLMRMAQLRVLKLTSTGFLPMDILIDLKNHRHLHPLCLDMWESMTVFPDSGLLPQNLRFLALSFGGTWNTWHADLLPTLGKLQNLVNLMVGVQYQQDDSEDPDAQSQRCQEAGVPRYEAPIMSSPVGGFPRLRDLTLCEVQASKLIFQAGTMPKLVELSLVSSRMTTVPEGLLDLPSLEKLELNQMKNELPKETHELLKGKGIRVVIIKGE